MKVPPTKVKEKKRKDGRKEKQKRGREGQNFGTKLDKCYSKSTVEASASLEAHQNLVSPRLYLLNSNL